MGSGRRPEHRSGEPGLGHEPSKLATRVQIPATAPPLCIGKGILWAISVGNYTSADIYVERNRKLKKVWLLGKKIL